MEGDLADPGSLRPAFEGVDKLFLLTPNRPGEAELGRDVSYVGDDLDAWAERARAMLPESAVDDLRAMYRHFLERGLVASAEELDHQREVLGREPRPFDAFVRETAEAWQ